MGLLLSENAKQAILAIRLVAEANSLNGTEAWHAPSFPPSQTPPPPPSISASTQQATHVVSSYWMPEIVEDTY